MACDDKWCLMMSSVKSSEACGGRVCPNIFNGFFGLDMIWEFGFLHFFFEAAIGICGTVGCSLCPSCDHAAAPGRSQGSGFGAPVQYSWLGVLRGFGGTCEEGPGPRAGRVMAVP